MVYSISGMKNLEFLEMWIQTAIQLPYDLGICQKNCNLVVVGKLFGFVLAINSQLSLLILK